ncbi:hypothetical protein [Aquihabitans sp. McL0605]|uniref:hypothetical protein n=1 Tax=Aquihabitans sp. McL0605 TaxID=3415671 RepID=UPI003CFB9A42
MQRHRKYLGAAAVCAALLLSACGTSGGSDSSKDTTTTKPKTTTSTTTAEKTTTTAATNGDAEARAKTVDLTVSDFPDGWTATPTTADDSASPMDACDPSFADDSDQLAKFDTDTFVVGSFDQADGTQFGAETVIFTDADAASAAIAPFKDPTVVTCIDKALQKTLTNNGELKAEGSLADDSDLDLGTDDLAGLSGTYKLTAADGTTVNATVAMLVMTTGDVGTQITIVSLGDSLDASTLKAPIEKLATLQGKA